MTVDIWYKIIRKVLILVYELVVFFVFLKIPTCLNN